MQARRSGAEMEQTGARLVRIDALPGVAPGRCLDRRQPAPAAFAHLARVDLRPEVRPKPRQPVAPPRCRLLLCTLEPLVGGGWQLVVGPVAVLVGGRRIDHAGDMARSG